MEIKQHTFIQPVGQRRNHRGILKYLTTNENKNATYQNLWDASEIVKAVKFYITKEEKYQININKLEKEQTKPNVEEEKVTKIQAEINQTENLKSNRKNQLNQEFVFQ